MNHEIVHKISVLMPSELYFCIDKGNRNMKPLFIPAEEQKVLVHQITETLIRRFFISGKKYISGPELLHFCDNPQVNRFIFFQLHQEWGKYQAGLRHPAYNFDHEEVKKAMNTFLNILSAHILMNETQFRVYVEKAVFNTLSLLLNPEETFTGFYFSTKEGINLSILEKNVTYFHYFDFILQGIILYHQQNTMPLVRKRIFLEKFMKAEEIAIKKGKSLEVYRRDMFHKLTGKDLFEVARTADGSIPIPELGAGTESKSSTPVPFSQSEENIVEEEQVIELSSQPESPEAEIQEEIASEIASSELSEQELESTDLSTETDAEANPEESEISVSQPEPEVHAPALVTEPTSTPSMVSPTEKDSTEEQKPESGTDKKTTLADLFQQNAGTPIKGIKVKMDLDTIPIHKQFQFSQKIFKGNSVLFREFIQSLSKVSSKEEAEALLQSQVIQPNQVNQEDELFVEFYTLVMQGYEA